MPRIVPTLSSGISLTRRRRLGLEGACFTRVGTAHVSLGRPDRTDDVPALCDIFVNIFMPTTVHIPDPLLKSVDRRAKALGISRNRLVVRALEQAVRERSGWTPEFLERLRRVDSETSAAADQLLDAVKQARRSKDPPEL